MVGKNTHQVVTPPYGPIGAVDLNVAKSVDNITG